ncbi:MAG: bifunctional DNA-formamidopyrimidine glycosylase/DNA-(apurinic or apyrimidinic site) lyase [Lactobacillus sp.]|jgi:formamidopyrimidine-DNA glycosylase|nr:bifunctional DNA-formamidopyrimidine glycosylase/DNA-(apurinic or apyrimidinic site) lyase [Lactobacillus sp.]
MPEMPEVETVRRTLGPLIAGKQIQDMRLWYPKIITGDAEAFRKQVIGHRFEKVDRYGKFLELRLDGGLTIVSHLRMEGKYRLTTPSEPKDKHDHLEFLFTDGTALRYNDVRKFGRMQLVLTGTERQTTGIGKLGPEPNSREFTWTYFWRALQKKHKNIKTALLDQTLVCGLGNIYVDEVLWFSQIQPLSPANQIPAAAAKNLYKLINVIIARATQMRGTTVHTYLDASGRAGGYQLMLHVYGRVGQPCDRCSHILQKIKVEGRGTTFCPHCQEKY